MGVAALGFLGLSFVWISSCSLDEREVALTDGGVVSEQLPINPVPGEPGPPGGEVGPRLAVAPLTLGLGAVVLDLAAVRTISIGNTGNQLLAAPSISLAAGSAAEFSILQNGCLDPLEPEAACSVSAQFLPVASGDFTATLLVDAAAAGSASVALSGTGLPPGELLVTAAQGSAAQFGNVRLGEPSEATFTIVNPAAAPTGPLAIGINNPDFVIQPAAGGECLPSVTDLPSGATCDLRVVFTPTRREPSEAILTVSSAALGSSGLRLDGVGSAPAALALAQEVLSVRAVLGQAAQLTVTVENRGDEPATLIGASVEVGTPEVDYQLVQSACSGLLEGGQSCEIGIEFRPAALGLRPATLVVTREAGEPLGVPIEGEGLKPGALVVTSLDVDVPAAGQAVDYGAVRRNTERVLTFRVTNPGAESTGLFEQIVASGDFSVVSPGAGECSPASTLVNGQTCDLSVSFRPLQRGPRDGSLTVVSVGAGSVALPLRGVGTLPADLSAAPANVQLGSAVLGETRTAIVTVSNDGDEAASPPQTLITGAGAEAFSVSGCGAQLEPLTACDLTVAFSPTSDPAHTALLTPQLTIASVSGGSANVSLTGRGLRPGSLELTPAAGATTTYQATVNGTQTQVFNVTNTGGAASGALTVSVANPAGRRNFELTASGLATACQTGQVLPPGGSCSVGVVFRPVQPGAAFSATLSAASSGAGTDTIALAGVAQALAALSSPDAAASFPNGGASPEFAWRIDNAGDVGTGPLTIGALPVGFTLAPNGNCPVNQAAGLPARTSCTLVVRFTPTQQAIQGQDQVLRGTITVNAGLLSVALGVSGTIPRALAGRGQVCVTDADCLPGLYSICGSSGRNDLPNVCCDSLCRGSSCSGCSAGPAGGTCSPLPLESTCVTTGTSRAGLCLAAGACTEYCIIEQSLIDQCLLRN
jgi:hypothetical protein